MSNVGLVTAKAPYAFEEVLQRLRAAVQAAGAMIFAEIDHAQGAADAGLALRPTTLVLFGHPKGGTPLMQVQQTAGLDLPLKMLVWEDESGQVWVTCNEPRWIAERHGADPDGAPVAPLEGATKRILSAIVGPA